MRTIYYAAFIILIVNIFSCNSNETKIKERELALKEKELELREKELKEKENTSLNELPNPNQNSTTYQEVELPEPVTAAKFVYVIFSVKEPKLYHEDSKYIGGSGLSGDMIRTKLDEINYVTYDEMIYTTEIKEVPAFDENAQYKYMDKMEAQLRQQFSYINMKFHNNLFMKVRDENERAKLEENDCKIVDRKLKVFDTYKEASVFRNNNKGKF